MNLTELEESLFATGKRHSTPASTARSRPLPRSCSLASLWTWLEDVSRCCGVLPAAQSGKSRFFRLRFKTSLIMATPRQHVLPRCVHQGCPPFNCCWSCRLCKHCGRRSGRYGGDHALRHHLLCLLERPRMDHRSSRPGSKSLTYAVADAATTWQCSEIYPLRIRSFAAAYTASCQWLFQFIIARSTPAMSRSLGYGMFFLFGAFCFCAGVFAYFFIPGQHHRPPSARSAVTDALPMSE